ncbi:O-antigen ligase family protein [Reyranella sp.]|uniref:O-antigen ligase family protein n=1 Tax=Reyranella sp. TaxID=1929291 RepID=UPI003D10FF2F
MSPRSTRRRSRSQAEGADGLPGRSSLELVSRITGWLVLSAFLLVIFGSPLPLGSNREWAWAPILMVLGVIGILCALGLGDTAGFRVESNERWPLLALVICFVLFTFVGLLQMSTYAPVTGSGPFYARAAALLGQAHAVVPSLSVDATRNTLLRCLACVLVFVIARALFREPDRARLLVFTFLLSAIAVMVYALLQQSSTGGCYVGSLLKKQGEYTNDRCLMSGTFANSNSFGCFAGMALAAALACMFRQNRGSRAVVDDDDGSHASDGDRFFGRLDGSTMILGAMALLFVGTQLFSSSRAAFAVTVVMVIAMLYLSMRGRWRSRGQVGQAVVIGTAIGVLVLVIAGGAMLRKVSLLSDSSNFNRAFIWEASLRAAQASPWLGWGLGTFPEIYAAYQPDEISQVNDKAHSTPIELYVETGVLGTVPGLLMALIPWGVCLWGALQRRRQRHLLVAAFAVPGIAMLHSAVDFSLQIPAVAFISAAFLGMGWAQTFHHGPVRRRARREVFTGDED